MKNIIKKLVAEFIGTFVLVFFACGVAAITGGKLVETSLTFGLVIIAMAYSIGRISGCHINPAVSFGCFLSKRMTLKECLLYSASQVLGGLVGGIAIFGIAKIADVKFIGNACNMVIGNSINGFTAGNAIASLLVEIILTCVFVYVILNVTDDKATEGEEFKRGRTQIAGIIIGLTLTLVHLIGIQLTGTSVNPARSIATAVAALIFDGTALPLSQVWIFIVGPLAGGALAALLFKFLHRNEA